MNAHLYVRTGPNSGEVYPLNNTAVVIGRGSSCSIRLADPFISREHSRIEHRGQAHWVVDLGSMNCTAVNGIPVGNKQLESGDEIHIGSTRILFFPGNAPQSAAGKASEISRTLMSRVAAVEARFEMIGSCEAMRKLYAMIDRVAPLESTVMITGESGTGKELVAKALHQNGPRAGAPLISVNCAAIARELAESELFGHEKGAFTGAFAQRIGKFELANGGTLFLDEIGELALDCQAKLLRVLEEKRVTRVGGERDYKVNVRVVAATHQDLHAMVRAGTFRRDLLYRLEVICLRIPALRERPEDIEALARHFLDHYREKVGRRVSDFSDAALGRLKAYEWPGNVREMKNVIERAVIMGVSHTVEAGDIFLPETHISKVSKPPSRVTIGEFVPLDDVIKVAARKHIEHALYLSEGNKKKAAELLGIPRSSLYDILKKYDVL
jgi:two-component system response regulator HydG